jgi:hypothetical protein
MYGPTQTKNDAEEAAWKQERLLDALGYLKRALKLLDADDEYEAQIKHRIGMAEGGVWLVGWLVGWFVCLLLSLLFLLLFLFSVCCCCSFCCCFCCCNFLCLC